MNICHDITFLYKPITTLNLRIYSIFIYKAIELSINIWSSKRIELFYWGHVGRSHDWENDRNRKGFSRELNTGTMRRLEKCNTETLVSWIRTTVQISSKNR
jgi:hypothetical protein